MPGQQHDLHGNAPDTAPMALLLIDVINDLDFAHGQALLKQALPMAKKIAALKRRAKAAGIRMLIHTGRVWAYTLILTGIAGNICVLFTANDAYMRGYRLIIPADCVASQTVRENTSALHLMQTVLKADVRPSTALDLPHVLASPQPP